MAFPASPGTTLQRVGDGTVARPCFFGPLPILAGREEREQLEARRKGWQAEEGMLAGSAAALPSHERRSGITLVVVPDAHSGKMEGRAAEAHGLRGGGRQGDGRGGCLLE